MRFLVNDECVCELSDTMKKVICNDIHADEFEQDMKRRVNYIIMHKYERCLERLKQEWLALDANGESKLTKAGVDSIPLDNDKFAELVFAQAEYKDRKAKELAVLEAKVE